MSDGRERWLDGLAGGAAGDDPQAREGAAVGAYFRRRAEEEEGAGQADGAGQEDRHRQRMLHYLRERGAFAAAPAPAMSDGSWQRVRDWLLSPLRPGWRYGLAGAMTVGLAAVLVLRDPGSGSRPAVREMDAATLSAPPVRPPADQAAAPPAAPAPAHGTAQREAPAAALAPTESAKVAPTESAKAAPTAAAKVAPMAAPPPVPALPPARPDVLPSPPPRAVPATPAADVRDNLGVAAKSAGPDESAALAPALPAMQRTVVPPAAPAPALAAAPAPAPAPALAGAAVSPAPANLPAPVQLQRPGGRDRAERRPAAARQESPLRLPDWRALDQLFDQGSDVLTLAGRTWLQQWLNARILPAGSSRAQARLRILVTSEAGAPAAVADGLDQRRLAAVAAFLQQQRPALQVVIPAEGAIVQAVPGALEAPHLELLFQPEAQSPP